MKQFKHAILLTTVLAFMVHVGNAQDESADTRDMMHFGVKIGTNVSNVYDSEGEDFTADFKLGLAGGVFSSIPLGTYLGIQPELLFSQKGYMGSGSFLGSEYTYTRTSNYIDVPIFVAIKPIESLTILAGPQFSYLVQESFDLDNEFVGFNEDEEFDNDNIRKNTLSMVSGFDVNFEQFVVGARVGIDIQDNDGDGTSSTPRYKNIWYQATVGYRLFSN
ncbi:MAG: porin family protein [Bacteroidales bacterium]